VTGREKRVTSKAWAFEIEAADQLIWNRCFDAGLHPFQRRWKLEHAVGRRMFEWFGLRGIPDIDCRGCAMPGLEGDLEIVRKQRSKIQEAVAASELDGLPRGLGGLCPDSEISHGEPDENGTS
jgi:hypothetical protein